MLVRAWHAVIAVLVVILLVLQIVVAVRVSGSPHDVTPGVVRGTSLIGRLIRIFSFFTIESNLLSGIVSAQLWRQPARDGRGWRGLRLAALMGITVTGIVYSTVLAAIHQPNGALETLLNTIAHYIVPIMMVLGWLLFGPRPRIDRQAVLTALLFPVMWLIYTLIRGAIWSWYPYPFLDVPSHGYLTVAINCVGVTAVFAVVAGMFSLGDRRLPRQPTGAVSTD